MLLIFEGHEVVTTPTTTSTTPQPPNERPVEEPPRTHEIVPDLNVYPHHIYPHIMQSNEKGKSTKIFVNFIFIINLLSEINEK